MSSFPVVSARYGKSRVRLLRVFKESSQHIVKEYNVQVLLEGDIDTSYTKSDNTVVVPTDTVKNTVYILAKRHPNDAKSPEAFALLLANHFINTYAHIHKVNVDIQDRIWQRLPFKGQPHAHCFSRGVDGETRVVSLVKSRGGPTDLTSGIDNFLVMKTTQSGFENYINDAYTSLQPTADRIFCTIVKCVWKQRGEALCPAFDFDGTYDKIKTIVVETFTGPTPAGIYSPSVQGTMYEMATNILSAHPHVETVELTLPNKHAIPFQSERFGQTNGNEIFYPTDEPHGTINVRVGRSGAKARM